SLKPLTAYAHSKVDLENELSFLADKVFSPVYLRNGTAFGISANMRFDLVVNNLMGWAYTTKEIKILSDGLAWRPIVHIRDIANAFIAILKAPRDKIHNEAFNVGIDSENYQVKEIAFEIRKLMRDCEIKILGKNNPDQRNYIVNFNKIKKKLKYFKPQWNLKKGIKELYERFNDINLTYENFQNKNFTRIKQLKFLINNNMIDENLYWI
ncbi:MAG: NAD-dependent epimerase/dehydratase family protein, partial [Promethearchaeota archaeon]